jgi:hypothetical protein
MNIDRGMLFKTKVGYIIPGGPVRIEISGEFEKIPVLVQFPFGALSFLFLFIESLFAHGTTGRLHQSGVNSYALVDG